MSGNNGVDKPAAEAAKEQLSMEFRSRLANAEIEAVLKKYDLHMGMRTVAINGIPAGHDLIFQDARVANAAPFKP